MSLPTEPGWSTRRSLARHVAALVLVLGLAGAAVAWTAETPLSGAVIATGTLVVESSSKKVQHPTGGVVAELRAEEGRRVEAGELLVRLDATVAKANLDAVTKSLWELSARSARLEAERDGRDDLAVPADLAEAGPVADALIAGERSLFRFRRDARAGQTAQLRERVRQLQEEIVGLAEQGGAKEQEIAIIAREYAGVQDLWQKSLIQLTRVTSLEREMARLRGERGALTASTAQARAKIAETELQILQLAQDVRSEVSKELAEIRARRATLTEQQVTARDQIRRIDIRAPQAGTVHELAIHTRGGVIAPGEPIMMIVPTSDTLVAEVRVAPQDIDQIRLGQPAALRIPNFDHRTTPDLPGTVSRIAADVTEDKRTGLSYYLVRLTVPKDDLARLHAARLMPGMPIEAFIRTSDRTVIGYLSKPLLDQARRAFREK
ncbi:hemolysin secretion protein D [Methylobacterium variabile]|jgi:HlyD family secretion protein|uniref:Membrane fusion protein (MFP) family protein n=1 Tax=Methylobacterium variabile TaxID=298794 RepID=A0A0J6T026_9HYPH|nr:HlyD family type I secretion periplasmic adaptor subunit [Methylobacterium variabile]KMO38933.1 hemolysin secretion protein D [Methylobacterium variabile]